MALSRDERQSIMMHRRFDISMGLDAHRTVLSRNDLMSWTYEPE